MSVEFRQRRPGEYVRIALKRKWLILLPTIAVTIAVAWVVYRLPDVYESSTLIVVKPSTLPSGVVPTVAEDTDAPVNQHYSGRHQPQFARATDGQIRPLPC